MAATTWDQGWGGGAWGYNTWSGISPAYAITDGVSATGAVGSVFIVVTEIPVGVVGTGAVENVNVSISDTTTVTGVVGTGAVDGFIVTAVIQNPVGVSGSGTVNNVVASVSETIVLTGVQGVGEVGGFIVQVDDIVVPDTDNLVGT